MRKNTQTSDNMPQNFNFFANRSPSSDSLDSATSSMETIKNPLFEETAGENSPIYDELLQDVDNSPIYDVASSDEPAEYAVFANPNANPPLHKHAVEPTYDLDFGHSCSA